jgi:hypothetical protein
MNALFRESRTMSRNILLGLTALATLAATGCGSMVAADCQLQSSANGPYVIKFTATGAASAGCATDTPDTFGDAWTFDPFDNGLIVAFNPNSDLPDPPDSNAPIYAKGHFDQAFPGGDNLCTVSDMTDLDVTGANPAHYKITSLKFLNTAVYLGTTFDGTVTYTHNACTRDYSAQALNPFVTCGTKEDCDPFAQPFASGINSQYDTDCVTDTWATDLTGGDGICFFIGPFPGTGGWKPVQ